MRTLVLLLSIIITFNSCETTTQGCTDPYAINYQAYADIDNGSCFFQKDIVLALNANAKLYLDNDDYATRVDYYINGDIIPIGTDYWNNINGFPYATSLNPPSCIDPTYTSFTFEWDQSNYAELCYVAVPNGGDFDFIGCVDIYKDDYNCIWIEVGPDKGEKSIKIESNITSKKKAIYK